MQQSGIPLPWGAQASHRCGFSCIGSRGAGFGSCVSWAELPLGMSDLPGPGIKPKSPALSGGFPSTASPGKSLGVFKEKEGKHRPRNEGGL